MNSAQAIGAGHTFIIFLEGSFLINVLNAIKRAPEVCEIYCATANQAEVILAESGQGRAILGVVDGFSPKGVETNSDIADRKALLRKFGYKL